MIGGGSAELSREQKGVGGWCEESLSLSGQEVFSLTHLLIERREEDTHTHNQQKQEEATKTQRSNAICAHTIHVKCSTTFSSLCMFNLSGSCIYLAQTKLYTFTLDLEFDRDFLAGTMAVAN